MKKHTRIRNLDTLEKEIYRQELEAKKMEEKMSHHVDNFREHFFTFAKNSFNEKREKENKHRSAFFDFLFTNEHVRSATSGIADRITKQATDAINSLVDRLFRKHTSSTNE